MCILASDFAMLFIWRLRESTFECIVLTWRNYAVKIRTGKKDTEEMNRLLMEYKRKRRPLKGQRLRGDTVNEYSDGTKTGGDRWNM